MTRLEDEFGSGRWKSLRGSLSNLHLARSSESSRRTSTDLPDGAAAGLGHAGSAAAPAAAAASSPPGTAAEARGVAAENPDSGAACNASDVAEQEGTGQDALAPLAGGHPGGSAQPQHVPGSLDAASEAGAAGAALGRVEAGGCLRAPGALLARMSPSGRALPSLPEAQVLQEGVSDGDPLCGLVQPGGRPDPCSGCAPAGAQRPSQPSRLRGGGASGGVAGPLLRVMEHPLPSFLDAEAGMGGGRDPAPGCRVSGVADALVRLRARALQQGGASRPVPVPGQASEAAPAPAPAATPFTAAAQMPFSPPETPLAFAPGSRAAWPTAAPADGGHLVPRGAPGGGTPGAPEAAPDRAAGRCSAEGSAEDSAKASVERTASLGSSAGGTREASGCGKTPPANACSLADDPRPGKAASFESFEAAINAAIAAVHAERQRPVSAPAGLRLGFGPGSQPAPALEAGADWAAPLRLAMPKLRVKVASPRTAGLSGSGSSHASMPAAAQAPALGEAPALGGGLASAPRNPAKPSRSAPLARAGSAPFSPLPPLPARARAPVLAGKGLGPGPGSEPGRRGWLPDTPLAGPSDAGGPYSVHHRASYGSAGPHAGPHGAQVGTLEALLPGGIVACARLFFE